MKEEKAKFTENTCPVCGKIVLDSGFYYCEICGFNHPKNDNHPEQKDVNGIGDNYIIKY